jgi:UDP-sugar pyrophosphorylase
MCSGTGRPQVREDETEQSSAPRAHHRPRQNPSTRSPSQKHTHAGTVDDDKRRLLAQLAALDAAYSDRGLPGYCANAARLLDESRAGANPFAGLVPRVPDGEALDFGSPAYRAAEDAGARAAGRAGFVLVAGGLGERLGYSGIKLALPAETARGACFLQLYIESILRLQDAARARAEEEGKDASAITLPLAIMTSADTHARTAALLEEHSNFGAAPGQVTLMRQERVACLADGAGALALDPADRWTLLTKPHGHGDVHALMHSTGTAASWADAGIEWVCFFQDTNGLVFKGLLPALGVSVSRGFDLNSLAVPRRAGEAIGGLARLEPAGGQGQKSGGGLTINVEYNVLDPLLRATVSPEGDVDDPSTGFSPFPGNINQLVVRLSTYLKALDASGGVVGEFVNPKYADATRTAFKAPTRLECLMQDLPHALPAGSAVGCTVITPVWAAYSPVKTAAADAAAKAAVGAPTHSATAAEADAYRVAAASLTAIGATVGPAQPDTFNGVPTDWPPALAWSPRWALTLSDLASRLPHPAAVSIGAGSAFVVEAGHPGLVIGGLDLDGALVVKAVPGADLTIGSAAKPAAVKNKGWARRALTAGKPATEEAWMRGFKFCKGETLRLEYDVPGTYVWPEGEGKGKNVEVEEEEKEAALAAAV